MAEAETTERHDARRSSKRQRDYTRGSLWTAVFSLSLPMAVDQVVTAATRLVDLYCLGRLGPEVLAASSLGSMAAFVVLSGAMGIGIAGLAVVARRIGEGDRAGASHAAFQVLLLGGFAGVLFGGIGALAARPVLVVLGATGAVLEQGVLYLRFTFALLVLLILNLATNRVLRGAGEARTALWTMATGSVVTAALCPVLILGVGSFEGWGIVGSAVATAAGQGVGWVLAVAVLLRGRLRLRLRLRDARPDFAVMAKLLRIGLPVAGQMLLRSTSRLALAPLIASYGAGALAAYGIMIRLMMFPLSIGFGLGSAAGTLVGQNLGAGKPDRATKSAWIVAVANILIMSTVVACYFAWSRELVLALGGAGVVSDGVVVLRLMAPAYIFSALGVVMGRSLDGAGDTVPAMWVNMLTLWLVQLPAAFLLSAYTDLGASGIWLGIGCANVLNALILAFWFRRGGWKQRKI